MTHQGQQQQQQAQQAQEAQAKQDEIAKFQAGMTARQVSVLEGQLELDVVKEQNRMLLELEKQEHTEEEREARLMLDTEKLDQIGAGVGRCRLVVVGWW